MLPLFETPEKCLLYCNLYLGITSTYCRPSFWHVYYFYINSYKSLKIAAYYANNKLYFVKIITLKQLRHSLLSLIPRDNLFENLF